MISREKMSFHSWYFDVDIPIFHDLTAPTRTSAPNLQSYCVFEYRNGLVVTISPRNNAIAGRLWIPVRTSFRSVIEWLFERSEWGVAHKMAVKFKSSIMECARICIVVSWFEVKIGLETRWQTITTNIKVHTLCHNMEYNY